ncbi:FYVE zinc finger [Trinorchestia longiramus]|nr:FYVE zinc finger [Trinorchestia longiramus]
MGFYSRYPNGRGQVANSFVALQVFLAEPEMSAAELGRLVSESACERKDPGSNPAADMVDAARNTAWDLGIQPNNYRKKQSSSSRRVSGSSERKRDRGSQRSRGSSGSSAHKSASTRARLRQERLSDRFLAKLTGMEERPRVRRKSKKLPPTPGPEFGPLPPAPSGSLMPLVSEALEVLPALLPANASVGVDSLSQLPSLEEAIRLQRAYDLHNERLQKAQLSAASVRRSNTLPASDLAAYISGRRSLQSRPLTSDDGITQLDSESDHDQSHPRPRRHHHHTNHSSSTHRLSQSTDRPRQHRSKHSSSSRGRQRNENELDTNGNSIQPNHASVSNSNWPQERAGGRNDVLNITTARPQSFVSVGEESIRSSNDVLRDVEHPVHERSVNYLQPSLIDRNLPTNDSEFRVPVSIGECVSSAVAADPTIFGVHNLYHDMPVPDYQLSQPQEFADRSSEYNPEHLSLGERDAFELGNEVLVSPSLENFNRRRSWHHQGSLHMIDSPRETIQSSVLTTTSEVSDGSFRRYHSYYDQQPVGTSEVDEEDQELFANSYMPSGRKNGSTQQLDDISECMSSTLTLRHHHQNNDEEDEEETEIPSTCCRLTALVSENIGPTGALNDVAAPDQDHEASNDPSIAVAADDGVARLLKTHGEKITCGDRRGVCEDVGESSSSTSSDAGAAFSEDDELNDEEVALALQMAEVATAWRVRARFPDPRDLVQRLFVCISGVADQLQTNYASDLRRILRTVFLLNQTPDPPPDLPQGKADKDTLRDPDSHSTSQDSESLSVESAEDALAGIGSSSQPSSPSLSCNFPQPCPLTFAEHGLTRCSPSNTGGALVPAEGDGQILPTDGKQTRPGNEDSPSLRPNEGSGDESSTATTGSLTSPSLETRGLLPSPSSSSVPASSPSATTTVATTSPVPLTSPTTTSVSPLCEGGRRGAEEPPCWVPDQEAPRCMACGASFTMLRRRHHCRNCGKVFCGGCSEHAVPLTHYGIWRPVRVCNICFLQYLTIASTAS